MKNILASIITKKFFNIGDDPIRIILSYISNFKKVSFSDIPDKWKFITVFSSRHLYKLTLYEENLELYFGCNKNLCAYENYIGFEFAIQYSIFRYSKYFKRMILSGYTVDADGFQEYLNEEIDLFINHYYIRIFYSFLTTNLSKFNSIIKKYEYLRCTKYFCKTCKELYESGSRRICECHIPQESSESEESNESEESSESEDQDSSSNWETDNNDYNIGPLSLDEESSEDSSSGRGG